MSDLFGASVPADALEHLDDPEIRARWPAALAEMVDVMEAAHVRAGEARELAREHALRSVRALATHCGGRMFYLPQGKRLDQALRDREIWERFDGRNVAALASIYELTEIRIYEILREQRALATRRHQRDLFPEPAGE